MVYIGTDTVSMGETRNIKTLDIGILLIGQINAYILPFFITYILKISNYITH